MYSAHPKVHFLLYCTTTRCKTSSMGSSWTLHMCPLAFHLHFWFTAAALDLDWTGYSPDGTMMTIAPLPAVLTWKKLPTNPSSLDAVPLIKELDAAWPQQRNPFPTWYCFLQWVPAEDFAVLPNSKRPGRAWIPDGLRAAALGSRCSAGEGCCSTLFPFWGQRSHPVAGPMLPRKCPNYQNYSS